MIQELKKILKNQRGIALMMIMTAIILLMAIYGEFTFESKIARIKATNILDRSQAKLLAESGLQLAITRLRLYKEAYNKVQSNPSAKSMVPTQLLNQLWEVPFMYPIPVGANANRAFKDTVDKFTKESLLDGEMKVSIQNISNRMNLNLLRIDMTKYNPDQSQDNQDHQSMLNMSDQAIVQDVSIDQSLYFLLKRLVEEKREKDEAFDEKYSRINYQEMVTNLKYYMSDYSSMNQDPLVRDAESDFQTAHLTPKFGPMTSASELYAVPGWNDELIELIQNEFSVYPTNQIDFNKLTANMLKILIPNIQENDVKEFFLWRDDPVNPKMINSLDDFKKYVMTERLMGEPDFDARMKLFQQKGFTFGSNPNLFKVVSEGTYNRSNYTLVAYVVLPKQEDLTTTAGAQGGATAGTTSGTTAGTTSGATGGTTSGSTGGTTSGTTSGAASGAQNAQLLEPRIIDILIN